MQQIWTTFGFYASEGLLQALIKRGYRLFTTWITLNNRSECVDQVCKMIYNFLVKPMVPKIRSEYLKEIYELHLSSLYFFFVFHYY